MRQNCSMISVTGSQSGSILVLCDDLGGLACRSPRSAKIDAVEHARVCACLLFWKERVGIPTRLGYERWSKQPSRTCEVHALRSSSELASSSPEG